MSAHAEFERELRKRIGERIESLGSNLATGSAQSFEAYREVVGEIRGLYRSIDLIEEVTKHVEERINR